jgi:hypothetical protein
MDVGNLLAKASDNLSVRRAFGAAYEKDDVLIIPVAMVAGGGGAGTARSRHGGPAGGPESLPEGDPTGTRRSTGGSGAHGRRRGLWRAGAARGRLRREGRAGPLGVGGGRGHRRAGLTEPGAGARPDMEPRAAAQRRAMRPLRVCKLHEMGGAVCIHGHAPRQLRQPPTLGVAFPPVPCSLHGAGSALRA